MGLAKGDGPKGGSWLLGGGGPPSTPPGSTREDLRFHYEMLVDLYKHYMDLVVKVNVLFYAVTGALLSYVLTRAEIRAVRFALLLPVAIAVGYAVMAVVGVRLLQYWRKDLFAVRDQLKLRSILDVQILSWLLGISAALFLLVAFALLGIVIWPSVVSIPYVAVGL